MKKKDLLDKIYFKIVGMDFDQLSFQNHIVINEVIEDIKKLKEALDPQEFPPPVPLTDEEESETNILKFPTPDKDVKLRLMVVDEDIDIQSLIEYSLRNESQIELFRERSPQHALQLISFLKPDILLVDISMKSMSCLEFFKEFKNIEGYQDIEIIVGSHHPNVHERGAAIEMGAVDYIPKPYDLVDLGFKLKLRLERKKRSCG